ncbi:hypothetical protein P22_1765 [Propionispora sp. 2/2-37]|uniref:response regulator n=1 Tax=Propionispora sp. 2/2-37 TaxID=1677858 RepID=UPI0006BB5526|nr:response regulator [Propionispora sp. 2/2-37]CUH95688.1 hypothetical protein P22_1765 [Propionispora sp. 2/2-37]
MSISFHILHVEDEPQLAEQVAMYLQTPGLFRDAEVKVTGLNNIDAAKAALEATFFDLIILDLRLAGEDDGATFLKFIKSKRFVPVIFYTGLTGKINEETLVRVVPKEAGGLEKLSTIVQEIMLEGMPQFQDTLRKFVEETVKNYMWDFVNQYGEQMKTELFQQDARVLKKLVLRRLAAELREPNAAERFLPQPTVAFTALADVDPVVQPIEFYIIPPIFTYLAAGDVLTGEISGEDGTWVVLHPTCDMVPRANGRCKAEYVTVAKARPLTSFPEYKDWESSKTIKGKVKALQQLICNNKQDGQAERYWFLPGTLDIPHSIIDFQWIKTESPDVLMTLKKIASLDSPFAENLLASYSRYKGRIGHPRINVDYVMASLQPATAETQVAAGTETNKGTE